MPRLLLALQFLLNRVVQSTALLCVLMLGSVNTALDACIVPGWQLVGQHACRTVL